MKKFLIVHGLLLLVFFAAAQNKSYQCYPANWWAGMKWNKVQLMLYGEAIGTATGFSINYPGVKLNKISKVENKNYVFLDISIAANTQPGTLKIVPSNFKAATAIDFQIKPRRKGNGTAYAQGVTSKDFMYLIMPDRFSNGDPSNDRVPGMRDQSLNRDTVYNRHGGDLKGIQNHLDYLQDLGVTALWLNPVLENDMPNRTEHGYAFTNHYKIDDRIGGEKAYQALIDAMHGRGMKMIQDAVYNHVGRYHFTVLDPPMKDWLHQWPTYTQTNYKDQAIFDPNASNADKKIMADGWFTTEMPDMNQDNPFVANYLIQHAIWTVEAFGIDGWRIDTYYYNDLPFMNRCNQALYNDFPKISLFGETFVHGVPNQAYVTENNLNLPFKSNMKGATDFQTLWAINDAMNRDFGWTDGINNMYTVLAQDFLYKDPTTNVIFLDNHDLARFYSVVNEDMNKYLSSITWLLTCRGIPQWYYTSEFATTGTTYPNDGLVRLDFPGGWEGDKVNKFTAAGRTEKDEMIYQQVARLANFRKSSSALTTGKFMQFAPEDGVYVYFRYDDKQTVMVVMNTSKVEKNIKLARFVERTKGFSQYKNIVTKETANLNDFKLGSYKAVAFELLK